MGNVASRAASRRDRNILEATMKRVIAPMLTALAAVAVAGRIDAQQDNQHSHPPSAAVERQLARRVPVTVALVRDLPAKDAAAVIVRRPDAVPRDVILLRRATANGERLLAAAAHLITIRRRAGDVPVEAGTFLVREAAASGRLARRSLHTADVVVGRLRVSTPRDVPGIGLVRAYEIYLPSKAMRAARGW
jgi:hypothetical protein